jgi:hypothetical protein
VKWKLFPATPWNFGIKERYKVETKGKHTVVIGQPYRGSTNEYFDESQRISGIQR